MSKNSSKDLHHFCINREESADPSRRKMILLHNLSASWKAEKKRNSFALKAGKFDRLNRGLLFHIPNEQIARGKTIETFSKNTFPIRRRIDARARVAARHISAIHVAITRDHALRVSRKIEATTYVETSAKTARSVKDAFDVAALAGMGKLNSKSFSLRRFSLTGQKVMLDKRTKSKLELSYDLKSRTPKHCLLM
ncbi:unnamed protein product [Notodromas monacha]|uniref:Uncharacterized protein n=1 Tax=Notodromas monacha TaxID=399045 RepID=A0A7R9BRS2_9CRUS|nr:unnamed protein product [Notodromas monacha]CAG0920508.1 unnamed protein product [Notodromas monacha]